MTHDIRTHYWTASDGVTLGYRTMGEGPRVAILLHGLFSDGIVNWIKFGHAAKLSDRGVRVIMPDLRAHGLSDKPHDPAAYPVGILGRDLAELVAYLGLDAGSFDLGGFSLGARTTVQGVGEGLRPRRAIVSGMGLEGLSGWLGRKEFFLEAIARRETVTRTDPWFMAVSFMKTMKIDPIAAEGLLHSFSDAPRHWLDAFTMPTACICGTEDFDNGSAEKLAAAMPDATYVPVPGTHMSSVAKGEFGDAIAAFFGA